MTDLLRLEEVTAGYRDTIVLERVSLVIGAEEACANRATPATAPPNREPAA